MACPACHLFEGTCFACGKEPTRLARAVGPLALEHAGAIVDELQRLVVDAERVTADIEAARRDGEEAGRLAIIRAEVERHARQLEAFIEAVTSRAILFDAVFHAKTTRAGMDLEVGFRDGSGHDARVMLADLTRWLEATR